MNQDPNSSSSRRQLNRDDEQRRRIWGWTIGILAAVIVIVGLVSYLANKQRLASVDAARQNENIAEAPGPQANETPSPAATPTTPVPATPEAAVPGTTQDMVPADVFTAAPETYVGKQVSLDGKIDQVLSPQAFIMHNVSAAPEQKFLVILPTNQAAPDAATNTPSFQVDQTVTVNASVVTYDQSQAQAMAANTDRAALDAYQGKVMLVANSAPLAH